MFRKSIRSLQEELQDLESQSESEARVLVGRGVNSDQLVEGLLPISRKVVALRDQIRHRTPWKELVARRDKVQKQLNAIPSPAELERSELQAELSSLELYLEFSRRKPLTLKTFLLLAAIVSAMVFGPQLIVDWLAP